VIAALLIAGMAWLGFLTWLLHHRRVLADRLLALTQVVVVSSLAVFVVRDGDALSALFVGMMLGLLAMRGLAWLDDRYVEQPKQREEARRRGA
jgi:hypothetical protein